ncbi:type II secretion system F family protein [Demequina mangrovi]|uniref:Tight adherence protein B n=1 Tax=Demequina mangrovi TaxID=1043493 RepID=A0A1H7AED2_9MICO|nr:pilus assembly protein TadB [Demequina mangrovi]SEJ64003.1 tight adherence protein B [Demequina mangrovi]
MSGTDEGWDESLPRVVGLLRAGLPPSEAWRRAGAAPPRDAAGTLDRAVQAADALAARTGAPLSAMLMAIARAAADEREAHALRRAALAGPRLSARILLWLPLAGVALGALVDPRTLHVLVGTPLGWGLLACAALLTGAGRSWMRRLVRRAEGSGGDADAVVAGTALLAAALAAGAPMDGALRAVAEALDEPGLAALADALPGGSGEPPPPGSRWAPVARAVVPAARAGASPVPSLEAAAGSAARRGRTEAALAAGELGVRVTLPLALCLLPAFVAVGLLPLLVAVVGGVVVASG